MPQVPPIVLHGDTETACANYLRNHALMTTFTGGSPTISNDLVGWNKGDRWIVVSAEGAFNHSHLGKLERVRLDVDCYAEDRDVTHDLAQLAKAILLQARGGHVSGFGVTIIDVREEMGLLRLLDKETDAHRFYFALRVSVIPHTASNAYLNPDEES